VQSPPPCEFRDYPKPSDATYSRLLNGVRAFKQSGAKTLILSGGGPRPNSGSEAEVMRRLAAKLGVPEKNTMTETKSRNTMEHAINLAELLSETKNRRIGLVTSALHMLRVETMRIVRPLISSLALTAVFLTGCETTHKVQHVDKPTARMVSLKLQEAKLGRATLLFDVEIDNPYPASKPSKFGLSRLGWTLWPLCADIWYTNRRVVSR